MLVGNMRNGALYRPHQLAIWNIRQPTHPFYGTISFISLWKVDKNFQIDTIYRPIMLYLGHTKESKPIYGFKKIHWFLVNGEKLILNNNSIKMLETLSGL